MSWRRSTGSPGFDPDTELARLTAWLVAGCREISSAMDFFRVDYVPNRISTGSNKIGKPNSPPNTRLCSVVVVSIEVVLVVADRPGRHSVVVEPESRLNDLRVSMGRSSILMQ